METTSSTTSAKPAKNFLRNLNPWVVIAGLITTFLTMSGVYWLDVHTEFNPMGLYIRGILPIGAIFVGVGCCSGYGLMASWRKVKATSTFSNYLLVSMLLAYVICQYMEYATLKSHLDQRFGENVPLSFGEYYHLTTCAMSFQTGTSHTPGREIGAWGYGVRLLEIAGFVIGGALVAEPKIPSEPIVAVVTPKPTRVIQKKPHTHMPKQAKPLPTRTHLPKQRTSSGVKVRVKGKK
jgi:hypothetical protein